jgi:acyl-CoA reductase-like NAD-dependent aldehyde dehydrogenase
LSERRTSYPLFIGGEWRDGEKGAAAASVDPSTGEQMARVTEGTAADMDAAVEAAAAAASTWGETAWADRAAALQRLAERLEAEAEFFADLDVVDAGMPIRGSRRDVSNACTYLRYFASLASELKGQSIPVAGDSVDLTLRHPFGVVGRIVPFNHPLQFAAAAIAAPLAAGNTVVLKPAEQTPISSLHLAALAAEVLPAGAVNVVTGGVEAGSSLVGHPRVRRIGFTGSVATGAAVLREAADQIKVVSLELGGKNPLIVLPDVDPEHAAELATIGMNLQRTAGQSCGSTSRVYLHEDLHDAVLERLVARFGELRVGDPREESTDVGPLAYAAHAGRVRAAIGGALEEGAELRAGGAEPPRGAASDCFVQPTVLAGVEDSMAVAHEEIFGPVVSVLRWREEADVLARANALELGLTANVATNDLSAALRLSRGLEAGYVWVNGKGQRPFGAPFGGWKLSGLGEENSLGELLSYTRTKNVNLSGLG